jgi:predicted dehydrogenase
LDAPQEEQIVKRRTFIKTIVRGAATTYAASPALAQTGNVQGANERVNVALIGCGTRGMAVARLMAQAPNVAFVAACDVYDANANRARQWAGQGCQAYRDFRHVLERRDVHAVLVAAPDHWHGIITVLACRAGKDVYVEKPLAHNIREGRAMVDAARRFNRVVQCGTQHRSAEHYREVERIVQSGELGKVHFVRVWNSSNIFPNGIGRVADSSPPEGLDWDFYLGPAPQVPFNRSRFLSSFRWFWDYAGGFLTDWGTHRLDSVSQVMHAHAPLTVTAVGGRYDMNDSAQTPAVLQVTYEFPDFVLNYESNQFNAHGLGGQLPMRRYYRASGTDDRPHGEAFYGTNGTILSDRIGFEVYPEPARAGRTLIERRQVTGADRTDLHTRNFIECVRSRQRPVADVEIGHRSTTLPLLGNIAFRSGRKLRWNAEREEIIDDREASALLGRQARAPWNIL